MAYSDPSEYMRRQRTEAARHQEATETEERTARLRRITANMQRDQEALPPPEDLVVRGRVTPEGERKALQEDIERQRTQIKFEILQANINALLKTDSDKERIARIAMEVLEPDEVGALLTMKTPDIERLAGDVVERAKQKRAEQKEHLNTLVDRALGSRPEERKAS